MSRKPKGPALDELDERILWLLAADGRASVTSMAGKLGVAPSTVTARMASLSKSGALGSIHATVDFHALGLPIQAFAFVRLRVHSRAQVAAYARRVVRLPAIANVFHLAGGEDFIVHLLATSA